ncbi:hypothetical protein AB0L82_33460 [Nocardia sp. NPDC052001]|uniref:hypothetical protein n=1 Tax=Nocardia sp. NPDC052001 TaxID=3154853 RepID=UPI003435F928
MGPVPSVRAYADFSARYVRDHPGRLIAGYELYTIAARHPQLQPAARRFDAMLYETVSQWSADETACNNLLAVWDGLFVRMPLGIPTSADLIEQMLERALGRR